jgi:SAM-dependent methyltransferase
VFVPFNARPVARYVHPRAARIAEQEDDDRFNLDVVEEAAPNYVRWMADLCSPHLGRTVLEIGAGIGAVTEHLVDGREIVATDLSASSVETMRERFRDAPNVTVLQADVRTLSSSDRFDSILMINVLEHIRDDVATLGLLRGHLYSGGTIVIYVPALNGLYGSWDERARHFRRYSKWRLRRVLQEAGLEPVELRYANLLAIPAWFLFSVLRRSDDDGGTSLGLWDRTGVPLTRLVESHIRVPLGLNLLAVGATRAVGTASRSGGDVSC